MLTVIQGPTGSGKTFVMTRLMRKQWKEGRLISANFPLWYDKERTGRGVERWYDINEIYHLEKAVVGIDEGNKLFEARRWASFPISFAEKIAQHRHHHLDFFTTTQDVLHIDYKIRSNLHELYTCSSLIRIPRNEAIKPALQIISVAKQRRDTSLGEGRTMWLKGGRSRLYFISKYWTNTYYNTYNDIDMQRFLCRIQYEKKNSKGTGKWRGKIISRELINAGKARL